LTTRSLEPRLLVAMPKRSRPQRSTWDLVVEEALSVPGVAAHPSQYALIRITVQRGRVDGRKHIADIHGARYANPIGSAA
jgi:hypothetical protein